jgi:hypothetical protein
LARICNGTVLPIEFYRVLPQAELAGSLPTPLECHTLHDWLVELEAGQWHIVLEMLCSYQAIRKDMTIERME